MGLNFPQVLHIQWLVANPPGLIHQYLCSEGEGRFKCQDSYYTSNHNLMDEFLTLIVKMNFLTYGNH